MNEIKRTNGDQKDKWRSLVTAFSKKTKKNTIPGEGRDAREKDRGAEKGRTHVDERKTNLRGVIAPRQEQHARVVSDREGGEMERGKEGRIEDRRREGRKEGKRKGRREGRKEGRKKGREKERKEGRREGRKEGRKEGREEGRKEGREEGRKEGRRLGRKEIRKEGRKEGRKERTKEGKNEAS